MHGAYIHDLFVTGIREALIGKRESAKNNQNDSGQRDWFHIVDFSVRN